MTGTYVRTGRPRSRGRRVRLTLISILLLTAALAAAVVLTLNPRSGPTRPWDCASANDLITLHKWDQAIGRQTSCVVSYIDAAPDWKSWADPWIIHYRSNFAKFDWVDWYDHGSKGRRMILTQSLIPSDLRGHPDWLAQGAAGSFEPYARTLAQNLIRAGMGSVIIRLGHEANGTWYADSLPGTPSGDQQWARFWANTVRAMRSVPGAHFKFDWTVNAGVRPIPMASFYPGDSVVDIIGVDAYDSLPGHATGNRLTTILDERDGLYAVRAFARAHHKPMSIPEWGIDPAGQHGAVGDDPAYVAAIAALAHAKGLLYQSYFTGGTEGIEMLKSPRSMAVYRHAFGRNGVDAP